MKVRLLALSALLTFGCSTTSVTQPTPDAGEDGEAGGAGTSGGGGTTPSGGSGGTGGTSTGGGNDGGIGASSGATSTGGTGGTGGEAGAAGAGGVDPCGSVPCPVCEVGQPRCTPDGNVERCVAGQWQPEETCTGPEPRCLQGACTTCIPGAPRCVDANVLQTCAESGTSWEAGVACSGETSTCHDGSCVHCMPGSTRCNGDTPQRCSDDGSQWQSLATCDGATPVCIAQTGTCGCQEGTRRCRPGGGSAERDECVNGSWQPSSSCSADAPACHGSGSCGCSPGATRCDSPRTLSTCNNSYSWATVTCNDTISACNGTSCAYPSSVSGLLGCGPGLVCDTDQQCCWHATSSSTGTGECQLQAPFQTTCGEIADDFEYDCDGPNDCGNGQICCLTQYMRVYARCELPQNCTSNSHIVCDRTQGTTTNPACLNGTSCQPTANGILWTCRT